MQTIQAVRCPNCGSFAEREYLSSHQLIRTQCPSCDYLMILCSETNRVIEAYAPGLSAHSWCIADNMASSVIPS